MQMRRMIWVVAVMIAWCSNTNTDNVRAVFFLVAAGGKAGALARAAADAGVKSSKHEPG